jgi:hypothetical protein
MPTTAAAVSLISFQVLVPIAHRNAWSPSLIVSPVGVCVRACRAMNIQSLELVKEIEVPVEEEPVADAEDDDAEEEDGDEDAEEGHEEL